MTLELDTGATLSVISEETYHKLFPVETPPTYFEDLKSSAKNLYRRSHPNFGGDRSESSVQGSKK